MDLHKDITTEMIKQPLEFVKKAYSKSKKDNTKEEYEKHYKAGERALGLIEGEHFDNEKATYLYAAAMVWANQLAFNLFREGVLKTDDELDKEYRELEDADNTSSYVNLYMQEDKAEVERINQEQLKYSEHARELDLYKSIIGGMRLEEAKEKQKEYEEKMAEKRKELGMQ